MTLRYLTRLCRFGCKHHEPRTTNRRLHGSSRGEPAAPLLPACLRRTLRHLGYYAGILGAKQRALAGSTGPDRICT